VRELDTAFPVTYSDVADQLIFRSALRASTRQHWHENPWEDNWERTFWGFHRAVLVLHATVQSGILDPLSCAERLIECYRAMVNLLGEAHISERGIVTRGDFALCRRISELAIQWARRTGSPGTLQICEEMLAEVQRRASRITTERIPYYAILKKLYSVESDEFIEG
jgi:hypothetical protein